MARGPSHSDSLTAAWDAAVEVIAASYHIPPAVLRAESRGRGPRPPPEAWEAKKMAVHLAVILADCDYATIGRHVGLHRDTVASHCADMRRRTSEEPELEELQLGLERAAKLRLSVQALSPREVAQSDPLDKMLGALREYAEALGRPLIRHVIRQNGLSSDKMADHENVISLAPAAKRARRRA